MRCLRQAVAKSSTLVTASWRHSSRQRARFAAQFRSSANWISMRSESGTPSRFESAPQPASLWNNITISLDAPFNWPPASAPTRSRNKSLSQRNRRTVPRQRTFVRGRRRSDAQRLRFPSPRSCRSVEAATGITTELDEKLFAIFYERSPTSRYICEASSFDPGGARNRRCDHCPYRDAFISRFPSWVRVRQCNSVWVALRLLYGASSRLFLVTRHPWEGTPPNNRGFSARIPLFMVACMFLSVEDSRSRQTRVGSPSTVRGSSNDPPWRAQLRFADYRCF